MVTDNLMRCPFCGEDGFDSIGLKRHLQRGWCETFDKTDTKHDLEYVINPRSRAGEGK